MSAAIEIDEKEVRIDGALVFSQKPIMVEFKGKKFAPHNLTNNYFWCDPIPKWYQVRKLIRLYKLLKSYSRLEIPTPLKARTYKDDFDDASRRF